MAKGKPIDDALRTQAIAALLAGKNPNAVANELGLAESTVRNWASQLPEDCKAAIAATRHHDILDDRLSLTDPADPDNEEPCWGFSAVIPAAGFPAGPRSCRPLADHEP